MIPLGLSTEGNLRFKIDFASLIAGSKFTIFTLFFFAFEGNFPSTSPRGLIFGGAIQQRVFCVTGLRGLYLEGLIFGILRYFEKLLKSKTVQLVTYIVKDYVACDFTSNDLAAARFNNIFLKHFDGHAIYKSTPRVS